MTSSGTVVENLCSINEWLCGNSAAVEALATVVAAAAAIFAGVYALKTWIFEKRPLVHATGAFIISTEVPTNDIRDSWILRPNSPHTLQLVNVGRGAAKNVELSVHKKVHGFFLESINPQYSLPANQGTRDLGEIIRVHGQRFKPGDDYELEFSQDRKNAWFYIHYEDYKNKPYVTKVGIEKIEKADGDFGTVLTEYSENGIEAWKVVGNTKAE